MRGGGGGAEAQQKPSRVNEQDRAVLVSTAFKIKRHRSIRVQCFINGIYNE